MTVTVRSGALHGVDAIPIQVEVDLLHRLPCVCLVGLPAGAVKESAERVRSAMRNADLEFPRQRVVVNLAPADVPKDGTAYDLPIALGIAAANGQVPTEPLDGVIAVGELSLCGALRPVRGALSLALLARDSGKALVLPGSCAPQAALVEGAEILAASTLSEVVGHLRGGDRLRRAKPPPRRQQSFDVDLADVRGQALARRALEIAAAGAHHVLLVGPPGCGKSMLARRLPTLFPPMDPAEALEITRVQCAAGLLGDSPWLCASRPFRAPHHSVTAAGLVGGQTLRPGEVSLAHHGVLFLDEVAEFRRSAIELLREPLEEGVVRITRTRGSVTWPAAITLVLASNPCPCGHRGSDVPCTCTDAVVEHYQRKLSGPILDRIDLTVHLQPLTARELLREAPGERSGAIRDRVIGARDRQRSRGQTVPNGHLPAHGLYKFILANPEATDVIQQAIGTHHLSARGVDRVLKVARTIADLEGSGEVLLHHVTEALAYRPPAGMP